MQIHQLDDGLHQIGLVGPASDFGLFFGNPFPQGGQVGRQHRLQMFLQVGPHGGLDLEIQPSTDGGQRDRENRGDDQRTLDAARPPRRPLCFGNPPGQR